MLYSLTNKHKLLNVFIFVIESILAVDDNAVKSKIADIT